MPLRINDLRPPAGAKHARKRVGRGDGSGRGSYSGRGLKGQKSRSGGRTKPGFEGGQMSLIRKMPRKRGFRAPFRVEFTAINLGLLNERFPAGAEVDPDTLVAAGLLKRSDELYKVLAGGDLDHALTIRAPRVSAAARAKIESAGGTIDALGPRPAPDDAPSTEAEPAADAESAPTDDEAPTGDDESSKS